MALKRPETMAGMVITKCVLPVSHTLSDHHTCHGFRPLVCHVKNGSFSSSGINCMSMDSITEVFTISTEC